MESKTEKMVVKDVLSADNQRRTSTGVAVATAAYTSTMFTVS